MEDVWQERITATVGDKGVMNYSDFTGIIGLKNSFFVERIFQAIDIDNSGDISVDEFWETVGYLQSRDTEASVKFIFSVIDEDNSGTIQAGELKKILEASLEESGSTFTAVELDELVCKLRDMFLENREPKDRNDDVTFVEFERVMEKYPHMLSGLCLEGVNVGKRGPGEEQVKKKNNNKNVICKCISWMRNNPQLTITYALVYAMVFGLFTWMFLQYAGDCEGVDISGIDEECGVSRAEVMDFANQWRSQNHFPPLTVQDMKYMSFSRTMTKNDPLECQAARKRIALSWMLPIAKGAGQAMKGTFMIILLPVSRNLMTILQKSFLRHIFPFHDAVQVHKNIGMIGFFLAWLHTLCYVMIVYHWQDVGLYKQWSWAFPDYSPENVTDSINGNVEANMKQFEGVPSYLFCDPSEQPSALDVLKTWFGVTGIMLIVIYTVACLFALDYPKNLGIFYHTRADNGPISWSRKQVLAVGNCLRNFNNFWYTHHLFALFYICLLLHPLPHIPNGRNEWGRSDSWLWASVPIALYLLERIVRCLRCIGSNTVAVADIYKGNVVHLKIKKPILFEYAAGMYGYINIPELSAFEWHPFTFTSSPGDEYLGFHIRVAGDWTQALYDMVQRYKAGNTAVSDAKQGKAIGKSPSTVSLSGVAGPDTVIDLHIPFTVNVDGPFGAPAQSYKNFKVLILVGAGIGVTPFASVLNDLLDYIKTNKCTSRGHCAGHEKIKKVYFYWTTRMRSEVAWFKHLLEELAIEDTQGLLDINIHITSFPTSKDVRMVLLHLAQSRVAEVEGVDILSDVKTRAVTKFGRPEWDDVFARASVEFPTEKNVGVFFCGPNPLGKVLRSHCKKHSSLQKKFHFLK